MLERIEEERNRKREQQESFFTENEFDYDEAIDGQRVANQILNAPFRFEIAAFSLLGLYLYMLPK
jgi:hypothetical protein